MSRSPVLRLIKGTGCRHAAMRAMWRYIEHQTGPWWVRA